MARDQSRDNKGGEMGKCPQRVNEAFAQRRQIQRMLTPLLPETSVSFREHQQFMCTVHILGH